MSEEIKLPIRLIKSGESIKGVYKFPLCFVEGSNSEGYPTSLLTTSWYQFPPKGFSEGTDSIMNLFVDWYNSRPETIDHLLNEEISKMWLDTWSEDSAMEHLSLKIKEHYREIGKSKNQLTT